MFLVTYRVGFELQAFVRASDIETAVLRFKEAHPLARVRSIVAYTGKLPVGYSDIHHRNVYIMI